MAPHPVRPILDPVAVVVIGIATAVSLGLVGELVRPGEVPLLVGCAVALAGLRIALLVHPTHHRLRTAVLITAVPLSAALVVISPVFGAYAFLGYMEHPRQFTGWRRPALLVATATITALAQLGGPRGHFASWPLYGLLVMVNLAIAALVELFERQRELTVAELERTVRELRTAESHNARLRDQLMAQARRAGVQDERARLSREIHDTVAQDLVGIITQLEAAEVGSTDLAIRLARIRTAARAALGEARRAVQALASPRLDEDSLPDAVAALVDQVARDTGLAASFVLLGEPAATPGDADLLRVAQEGLANVTRHAAATRVVLTLDYADDEVRLDIRDDGRGFDPRRLRPGHGLNGMRARLHGWGGDLVIESTEGAGCALSAAIPR